MNSLLIFWVALALIPLVLIPIATYSVAFIILFLFMLNDVR